MRLINKTLQRKLILPVNNRAYHPQQVQVRVFDKDNLAKFTVLIRINLSTRGSLHTYVYSVTEQ